jgi:hypothetical protein
MMLSHIRRRARLFPIAFPLVCAAAALAVAAQACGPTRPAEHASGGTAEPSGGSVGPAPSADPSAEPSAHPAADDVEVPPAP